MSDTSNKTIKVVLTGTVQINVPLELPADQLALKKLVVDLGMSPEASLQDIGTSLILTALANYGLQGVSYVGQEDPNISVKDMDITVQ